METEIAVSLYAQRRLRIGKAHELADGFASVLLGGLVQRVFSGIKGVWRIIRFSFAGSDHFTMTASLFSTLLLIVTLHVQPPFGLF